MGYVTETSGKFPCACGKGTIQYPRREHDVYVNTSPVGWERAEIKCAECAARYVVENRGGGWWFCPKDGSDPVRAQSPDDSY